MTLKEETELLDTGADHHRRETVALGDNPYPAAALLDDLWRTRLFGYPITTGPLHP